MDKTIITPIIERLNNVIDSLIDDFKEYNLDEETIGFLVQNTRNFIEFSKVTLLNVIFGVLEKAGDKKYDFDDVIHETENLINKIFDSIDESLNRILPEEDEQECGHDHAHGHHHHHYHIDVDAVQEDIDKVISDLTALKKLLGEVTDMVLLTLRYQAEEINEKVFGNEFDKFKDNVKRFKEEYKMDN